MLKGEYSRFLRELGGRLHFAAHSHHPWPDRSREAQIAYWDDSAKHFDAKWDYLFGEVIPEVQGAISRALGVREARRIVFAPNTHELASRLLSCLPRGGTVLTTDSEFYSFERQIRRASETDVGLKVHRIPTQPFETLEERLLHGVGTLKPDLVFLSHVFFNSGFVVQDLHGIRESVLDAHPKAQLAIDAYHGFCAVPTDLGPLEEDIFYLAGGYKYAQSGEGVCFMVCPDRGHSLRPANTGWFSDLERLSQIHTDTPISYGSHGARFRGATMDFTALYRMRSVLPWLADEIGVEKVHTHVQNLQLRFLEQLKQSLPVSSHNLVPPEDPRFWGHFLTFEIDPSSGQTAETLVSNLESRGIIVDRRGTRVRFGFGAYHDTRDVDRLVKVLGEFKLGQNRRVIG